jgi:hypothetical protein
LHKLWTQSKETYPVLDRFSVEGERVLQLIVSFVDSSVNKYLELTRGSLLKLKKSDISELWESASKALAIAYEWVESRGAIPGMIANDALLVPIGYFLNKITEDWKKSNPNYLLVLERWYFSHSLQQGARQASNYKIGLSVSSLHNWIANGELPQIPEVSLKKDDLLTLYKFDGRYKAIHSILRWKNPNDLWTNEPISHLDVEDHHIFPAVIAKRGGKEDKLLKRNLDSIVNRLLVSRTTNRSLGDRYPSDYFNTLIVDSKKSGTLQNKLDIFQRACLPIKEDLSIVGNECFQSFIGARADLILAAIKIIVGDSLNPAGIIEDDDWDKE